MLLNITLLIIKAHLIMEMDTVAIPQEEQLVINSILLVHKYVNNMSLLKKTNNGYGKFSR